MAEVKVILNLDDALHRDFLKAMWTRQFLEQKIEDLSVHPPYRLKLSPLSTDKEKEAAGLPSEPGYSRVRLGSPPFLSMEQAGSDGGIFL